MRRVLSWEGGNPRFYHRYIDGEWENVGDSCGFMGGWDDSFNWLNLIQCLQQVREC
jgi:hypothetical protein